MTDETRAVLLAAADLLEPEGAWCQDQMALDARGKPTIASSPNACRWCASGAIIAVSVRKLQARLNARVAIRESLGVASLTEWNDAPERTQDEVVAALRAAAA